ncbi:carbonic anhydrase [Streptomyces sp. NBC_00019]|uniref:carbonic anhydrase n=1 Tax=Streptomyces sp. NBC_00019 TaxID=2975623 RepID=UPI0032568C80
MGITGYPQRRTIVTGGLAATAALLTGCSSSSGAEPTVRVGAAGAASTPSPAAGARPDSPSGALTRLMQGNRRWVKGALLHPDQDPRRREAVAEEQKPYAVVLSCIDSRVPPELVFDTGIGDLFVIRTGGQVVAPVVTGSVEYGPLTAGTPLIVVLGHQRCGAIKAAYKAMHDRTTLPGNLQAISESLRTVYEATVAQRAADPVDAMIRIHARQAAATLRSNTSLSPLAQAMNDRQPAPIMLRT